MEKKQISHKLTPIQLEQIIIQLKFELYQYKSKVQEYQENYHIDKFKNMKIQNSMLLKNIEEYKEQLKNTEDERVITKAKIIELEEENKIYKIQLKETKTKCEKDIQENYKIQQQLEKKIKVLQSKVEDFYEKFALQQSVQQSNETLGRELENYKAEKEKELQLLQTKITDYENELKILEDRNESMDGELENFKAEKEKEIQLFQMKITGYEEEMENQSKLYTTKITDYENELKILEDRNEILDGKLENYKAEKEKEIQFLQTKLMDYEEEME
ncbi:hypothetical protein COE51_19440, partial [Bacillus pseudomycoides]